MLSYGRQNLKVPVFLQFYYFYSAPIVKFYISQVFLSLYVNACVHLVRYVELVHSTFLSKLTTSSSDNRIWTSDLCYSGKFLWPLSHVLLKLIKIWHIFGIDSSISREKINWSHSKNSKKFVMLALFRTNVNIPVFALIHGHCSCSFSMCCTSSCSVWLSSFLPVATFRSTSFCTSGHSCCG